MSKVTYQSKLSDKVATFCEAMGQLFSKVERDLYKDLARGEKLKDLKRNYQVKYSINARQFNSIYANLKGKISSRKECYSRQIKEIKSRIKGLEKKIKSLTKKLKGTYASCGINGAKSERGYLKWLLHQKKRKLSTNQLKLESLKNKKSSFIFGGKRLWKSQYNLEENGYNSHKQWFTDWQQTRSSQFTLIGSKDESSGNQNCQLSLDEILKIRVPKALENQFGKYYLIESINFPYGQGDVNYALAFNQALTFRFVKKEKAWYVFVSLDLPETPTLSSKRNGMLGIDLNPKVIGWSYCDGEGNLIAHGQIKINIQDKNKNQTLAILGDACKLLGEIASKYQCPLAIENLDFSRKKASMTELGVKYSRMLSNFAYSCFYQILVSRGLKWGIEVIKVNPAYSSLIGLTKFMSLYGLSSDTAAGLVIARRALRYKERIPPKYARLVQVDSHRHVWSWWNALSKKLKGISRHSFFNSGANSPLEVNLTDELLEQSRDRSIGKPQGTSRLRWDSSAPVDNAVRSTSPTHIQLSLF